MDQDQLEYIITRVGEIYRSGIGIEATLEFLKQQGASQALSSIILQKIGAGNHLECKTMVFSSRAWQENREATIRLHGMLDKNGDTDD